MARVTQAGGYGVVEVRQDRGAGAFMPPGQLAGRAFGGSSLAQLPVAKAIQNDA